MPRYSLLSSPPSLSRNNVSDFVCTSVGRMAVGYDFSVSYGTVLYTSGVTYEPAFEFVMSGALAPQVLQSVWSEPLEIKLYSWESGSVLASVNTTIASLSSRKDSGVSDWGWLSWSDGRVVSLWGGKQYSLVVSAPFGVAVVWWSSYSMTSMPNMNMTGGGAGGIPWELSGVLPTWVGGGSLSVRQYRIGTGLWPLPNTTMQMQGLVRGTNDSSGWVDVSSIAGGRLHGSWYAPVLFGW